MKIGTSTINDIQHEWMKIFARLVETNSKGQIKVELYPASQLGLAPRMIEGTQFGTIQAFVGPPEFLSGVDSRYAMLGAPGLFRDMAHTQRVLQDNGVREAVLGLAANKGLKGVGLFIYAPAAFNFRSKVDTLRDFERKKIRVFASPIQTEPLNALNATAVPMALGEVLTALQQGTLDGVMSALPALSALRFYDAAKHMLETDHAAVTVVTVVSKLWYDKLAKELQQVIDAAGAQADKEIYPWALEALDKSRQAWIANGGTVARLPADEQAKLMTLIQPVAAQVASRNTSDKALFDLLKKAAAATSS